MKRLISAALVLLMPALCLSATVSAAEEPLFPALSGSVLAAVNTVLDPDTVYTGSFSSETPFPAEAPAGGVYAVHTDESGEAWVQVEPHVEWLEPIQPEDGEEPTAPHYNTKQEPAALYPAGYAVGTTKTIPDVSDVPVYRTVKCLYIGRYCTVWGSKSDVPAVTISSAEAASVGAAFDQYYTAMVDAFGSGYDADGDGKIAIFCYDIDDNYKNGTGSTYVAGTFRMRDMLNSSGYVNGVYYGAGNYITGMDAIHLDTYPTMGGASDPLGTVENAYSTLFHEFQHLINYSAQVRNGKAAYTTYMETYLNEAFSMAAEHMLFGPEACSNRVTYFSGSRYVPGTSLTCWSGNLSQYSNSYLFGQYIRTRYAAKTGTNGNSLFQTVLNARTPENEDDTLSIIAERLDTTPVQLVKDFWAAVYLKQPSGNYGFGGEAWADAISPYIYENTPDGTTGISNGGVKYYRISGSFTPSAVQNVEFLSFDSDGPAEEAPEIVKFDFAGNNMTLGNELILNFMFRKSDLPDGEGVYAVLTHEMADGEENKVRTVAFDAETWSYNKTYYFVSMPVYASQMADDITAVLYNKDGEAISNPKTCSVRTYLMNNIDKDTFNAKMKTVAVDMLNYGAASQEYNEYNVSDLASNLLSDTQKAYGTPAAAPVNRQIKGNNCAGANLSLLQNIELNIMFTGYAEGRYAEVTYTNFKGEEVSCRVDAASYSGGKYTSVKVNTVRLSDGDTLVNVTLYNADGTVCGTGSDSVDGYAARMTKGADLYEMVARLTASAKAYALG